MGVATPRPRSVGRERAARSAALSGATRPDQPCAWIQPDDDHHELTRADDHGVAAAAAAPSLHGTAWLAAGAPAIGAAAAAALLDAPVSPSLLDRLSAGLVLGRAPPPFHS